MDKCHTVHAARQETSCSHAAEERLSDLQKTWQCEAVQCSAAGAADKALKATSGGHECEMTVLYLEMEDQRLTQEQRQKKTRYLCAQLEHVAHGSRSRL